MPTVTALATLAYAAFPLEAALERIAARGFRRVEITNLGSYCRHLDGEGLDARRVESLLAQQRLVTVAINHNTYWEEDGLPALPDLCNGPCAALVEETVRSVLSLANKLGVGIVTTSVSRRCLDEQDWPARAVRAGAVIRRLCEYADSLGVRLSIEIPHLYQLADSVEHSVRLLEAVGAPSLGATLDSSHWGVIRYPVGSFVDYLGDRLCHIHLRDSAGEDSRDFRQELELTPGRGSVDFGALGAALDSRDYSGEATLEAEYRTRDLGFIERELDFGIGSLKRAGWSFPDGVN